MSNPDSPSLTPWRGSLIGAACTGAATLLLSMVGYATFDQEGGVLVLCAAPVAMGLGAALGRVATIRGVRLPLLLILGVLAAFLTAPLTGLGVDVAWLLTGKGSTEGAMFNLALIGAVVLSPGIAVAGLGTGWLVWRATRDPEATAPAGTPSSRPS